MKSLIILSTLIISTLAYVSYEDYKVFRVYVDSKQKKNIFEEINKRIPNLNIWNENLKEDYFDIMVEPASQNLFTHLLDAQNIQQEVFIRNVQELLKETQEQVSFERNAREFNWTSYHTYEQISGWLLSLPEQYPNRVTSFVAGQSFYEVDIVGVRIALNPNATRVAIIEGGIHSNEWVNPAAVTYIINAFLTTTNERLRLAGESMIWYIVPVFNPDGYNRTFHEDRLHRKNLQIVEGSNCTGYTGGNGIGTDLNRNFDFNWLEAGGASNNPCSVTYAGPEPFSAPEALAIKALVDQVAGNLNLYLSFHSFGQIILFPYGHTTDPIDNYYEQFAIGSMAANEIELYNGTRYTVGNIAEAIYLASGSSMDWVKATYGTRLAFCFELRDRGRYGFLLPADQIIDASQEVLNSVVVIVEQLQRLDLVTSIQSSSHKTRSLFYLLTIGLILASIVKFLL